MSTKSFFIAFIMFYISSVHAETWPFELPSQSNSFHSSTNSNASATSSSTNNSGK